MSKKKREKSFMKKVLLPIVIVLVLVAGFSYFYRAHIVAMILSQKIHTSLTMKRIDFTKGNITLREFAIKNPFGYKSNYALTSDYIDIFFPKEAGYLPQSNIDTLKMLNCVMHIDCKNIFCNQNNWTKIVEKAKTKKAKKEPIKIASVVLENFTVNLHGMGLAKDTVIHFDRLELSNISSDQGFPTQLLMRQIFKSAGMDKYLKEGVQKTTEKLLKKFF